MVGLTSLVGQRFGQGWAGVLSGLPVIAATITALLMTEAPRSKLIAVAQACVTSVPAAFSYTLAFAWIAYWCHEDRPKTSGSIPMSRRFTGFRLTPWIQCLLGGAMAFAATSVLLLAINFGLVAAMVLALCCPFLTLLLMPRISIEGDLKIRVPRTEMFLRMLIALVMAAALLVGAKQSNPALSGVLLSWPITGCVLPCFAITLYGSSETIQLLRGFAKGLFGFTVFFSSLVVLLSAGGSYALDLGLSLFMAGLSAWILMRLAPR